MEITWKFLEDGSLYVEDPVYKKSYVLPPHIAGMFKTQEESGVTNNIEIEKKVHFIEKDRHQLELLLPRILEQLGYHAESENYSILDQTDYYFDTPSLYYGKSKSEPSLRTREKTGGKLKSTYKIAKTSNRDIAEREEIDAIPQSTSPSDFIKAMSDNGVRIYPDNIELSTKVSNHRKKLVFQGDKMNIVLAIDDITNFAPKTNINKKSENGEFEMEIKNAKISVEEQREILEKVWKNILEKCNANGISLTQSKHNKYVSSLIELGLLKEYEQEEAVNK